MSVMYTPFATAGMNLRHATLLWKKGSGGSIIRLHEACI